MQDFISQAARLKAMHRLLMAAWQISQDEIPDNLRDAFTEMHITEALTRVSAMFHQYTQEHDHESTR